MLEDTMKQKHKGVVVTAGNHIIIIIFVKLFKEINLFIIKQIKLVQILVEWSISISKPMDWTLYALLETLKKKQFSSSFNPI